MSTTCGFDQFAQLGMRGVCAVLFGSGDNGVGRGTMTGDGSARFIHKFPASCYVWLFLGSEVTESLSLLAERQTSGPGVAASFSGGGFSYYFARPSYWDLSASAFLQDLGSRYQGLYNVTSHGIPDIAAQAINF
ncbi:hypothetical protein EDB92DRAFT_1944129 [Lactarius akahatsu]|uniref:Uncharacterized protein n=1 Tax=Lactarius akahatsu TaxID=416441 RepID=A0AAD4LKC7_9AGAM|nr:hypothetical protein EDB92DRAFT_1944129 [Lactarius akahatsu]